MSTSVLVTRCRVMRPAGRREYAAAMAEALAAAQLAGRYEVLQEAAGNG